MIAATRAGVRVRPLLLDETSEIHALNQSEVPRVGDVSRHRLLELLIWADVALGAEVDGRLAGLVIGVGPGSGYDSVNYRWFSQRYDDFLYVDRVVVDASARGQGVGTALYDAALERYPAPLLLAEVNVEPPNPDSMAFHQRYGFREVARVEHALGEVVAMLAHETGFLRDEV